MNRQAFEQRIAGFRLKFLQTRDTKAENSRLPSFLEEYHRQFNETATVPDQETYVNTYLTRNDYVGNEGVEARCRRAYSSLVREHHLGYVLGEHFNVQPYSITLDREFGIDYVIEEAGRKFFVHAFVDTPQSNMWRRQKDVRHPNGADGIHLDCAIDPKTARRVGEFWVYSSIEMEGLKRTIHAHS